MSTKSWSCRVIFIENLLLISGTLERYENHMKWYWNIIIQTIYTASYFKHFINFVTDSKAFVSRCGYLHKVINTISKICFSIICLFMKISLKYFNHLYNKKTYIWCWLLPIGCKLQYCWMKFKDSLACIQKFVESDDKIKVMSNVGDLLRVMIKLKLCRMLVM